MKSWSVRLLTVVFVAVVMLFAVSGLTAMAQVVNYDFDGYTCYDLDGDGYIDTCSTCFDTDGDGYADTCYEDANVFDRIGQPIDLGDPGVSNDPVGFSEDPVGSLGPDEDPVGVNGGPATSDGSPLSPEEEGPIGSDAGKGGDEPIASDAGKAEE